MYDPKDSPNNIHPEPYALGINTDKEMVTLIEKEDEPVVSGKPGDANLAEVTVLIAKRVVLYCPYCEEEQDGFFSDPSGGTFDCDHCGKPYKVHSEADVEIR